MDGFQEQISSMSEQEDVVDDLLLHATPEQDPWTVDRAYQAMQAFDEAAAIRGLTWAIQQNHVDLQLLGLQLLRRYRTDASAILPAIIECIGSADLLVRLTAIETAGLMRSRAAEIVPLLMSLLESDDVVGRTLVAGNLLRIGPSEQAVEVLREQLAMPETAHFAAYYLRECEWAGPPPEDWSDDPLED
jgi:hypothetical protein